MDKDPRGARRGGGGVGAGLPRRNRGRDRRPSLRGRQPRPPRRDRPGRRLAAREREIRAPLPRDRDGARRSRDALGSSRASTRWSGSGREAKTGPSAQPERLRCRRARREAVQQPRLLFRGDPGDDDGLPSSSVRRSRTSASSCSQRSPCPPSDRRVTRSSAGPARGAPRSLPAGRRPPLPSRRRPAPGGAPGHARR